MKSVLKFALVGLVTAPMVSGPASGQSIVSRGQSFVKAAIVPGDPMASGDRMMGIALRLAPEWKTYWRSPGEAGIPPTIDWSDSTNIASAEMYWPRPEIFESFGLTTIGYSDRLILPVRVTPTDASAPIGVELSLELGVCRDICVLETTQLSQLIPVAMRAGGDLIQTALDDVPATGAEQGMQSAVCRITGAGEDRAFTASLTFDRPVIEPVVLLEGPEGVWFHGAETVSGDHQIDVSATLSLLSDDAWVSRKDVRMTVLADDLAADIQGCDAPAD